MKNITKTLLTTTAITLLFTAPAFAQINEQQETGNRPIQDPGQVKEEVQQQTQNEGEDVQIQIQTQESVQETTGTESATTQDNGRRSRRAREMMSEVAKTAEALLAQGKQFEGGIREEISKVAQRQKEAATRAQEGLEEAEKRTGWRKFLFGPNQDAIEKLRIIKEQNEERAKNLYEIQGEVEDAKARTNIQNMIQNIQEANEALEEEVQDLSSGFSLFGWAVRLFSRLR
ncbi:MAG: hypothetical protein U9M98_03795 [Patescibacteria group bacterium]|nr:hypothetical protein [Patescibacteria group bacterium]